MTFIYIFFCNRKKKEEQKPVKLEDEHIDDIFLSPPVKPHPPPKSNKYQFGLTGSRLKPTIYRT
jgi:putative NADH-flavin reductase